MTYKAMQLVSVELGFEPRSLWLPALWAGVGLVGPACLLLLHCRGFELMFFWGPFGSDSPWLHVGVGGVHAFPPSYVDGLKSHCLSSSSPSPTGSRPAPSPTQEEAGCSSLVPSLHSCPPQFILHWVTRGNF